MFFTARSAVSIILSKTLSGSSFKPSFLGLVVGLAPKKGFSALTFGGLRAVGDALV
jgi:hypothetical protein